MTFRDDAWRGSYDGWKLASPYDDWNEPEEEDDPLLDLLCAHARPMGEWEDCGLFDFWESEQ